LSYLLTQHSAPEAGLINDGISLVAIAATTFLALKIKSAERAATEARSLLEHISRVTTLGELTASIAHEVNQPLAATVINGNACLRWLGSNPPNLYEAQQAVERIIGDSNRASQIIARVRSLAKRSPPNRTYLHINKVIQETLQLMNGETEHNHVVLRTDLADDLPFVFGDRVQLQQVILNLVLNAIEAMSEIPQDTRILRVKTALRTPDAVVVAIQDTGSGLSSEKIDQIFDAFYSTKNGLGMGLAISRLIIEAHKGRIWPSRPRRQVPSSNLFCRRTPRPQYTRIDGRLIGNLGLDTDFRGNKWCLMKNLSFLLSMTTLLFEMRSEVFFGP
jgi:C4-dicarboxylate-specific signal transduction histidine kinase